MKKVKAMPEAHDLSQELHNAKCKLSLLRELYAEYEGRVDMHADARNGLDLILAEIEQTMEKVGNGVMKAGKKEQ